jgi:hypothetical protein
MIRTIFRLGLPLMLAGATGAVASHAWDVAFVLAVAAVGTQMQLDTPHKPKQNTEPESDWVPCPDEIPTCQGHHVDVPRLHTKEKP